MITKPMLAATVEDITKLTYPIIASPKLDGIRCLMVNGRCLSRSFKDIPNDHIRETMEAHLGHFTLDGELIIPGTQFNETSSAVMRKDGTPDFEYHVFDYIAEDQDLDTEYLTRISSLWDLECELPDFVKIVPVITIYDPEYLLTYEDYCHLNGYEGVMLRSPKSPYKCGRSSLKQQYLLKLKRFSSFEAEVIGFEELMHNQNEAQKDAFGRTERSSHKENLVPAGTLGSLLVKDVETRVEFSIGTGFDQALRQDIWDRRSEVLGQLVTYKCQLAGQLEKPRFPVFVGFRSKDDL